MRKTEFANGEYYHIYNRGVDKRDVFMCGKDYERFLKSMREFNSLEPIGSLYEKTFRDKKSDSEAKLPIGSLASELVDIICYCLNPNHYHFILQQLAERGIEKFMHRIGTSHTKYFNKKYDRSGSLFQGPYKSIHIDSNEYLLYLSAYVNANHFIHGYSFGSLASKNWLYSSLLDYLGKRKETLCNMEPVMGQFRDAKEYSKYVSDNALYMKDKKEMEKYVLE